MYIRNKIVSLIFIVIIAIGLALSLLNWDKIDLKAVVSKSVVNGDRTIEISDQYDQIMTFRTVSINFWKQLNATLFDEGTKGVLIGNEGWLFTTEEFQRTQNFEKNIQQNLNYILSIRQQFKEAGVHVIIIPVPAKARLYRHQLGRHHYPDYWHSVYSDFTGFLKQHDIQYVDTLSLFQDNMRDDLYFKTDTHWTSKATKHVARAISEPLKSSNFETTKTGEGTFKGDLAQYTIDQPNEIYDLWQTYSKEVGQNPFEDQDFSYVLIGTSYSADPKWHFDGFLKEALSADILNLSDEGQGPFQVMREYQNNLYQTATKPKTVIWEIPERYLPIVKENTI